MLLASGRSGLEHNLLLQAAAPLFKRGVAGRITASFGEAAGGLAVQARPASEWKKNT